MPDEANLEEQVAHLRTMIWKYRLRHSGACVLNRGAGLRNWCSCGLSEDLRKAGLTMKDPELCGSEAVEAVIDQVLLKYGDQPPTVSVLVGEVMTTVRGRANPAHVRMVLAAKLNGVLK